MRVLVALTMVALALAGCTDGGDAPTDPPQETTYTLVGQVLTPAFNPIQGAQVSLLQSPCHAENCLAVLEALEATTDTEGRFTLPGVREGNHTLNVTAADYESREITVQTPGDNLSVTLTPVTRIVPFQYEYPFDGYIECAAEYLIITPSCDTIVTFAHDEFGTPDPQVFQDDSRFAVSLEQDWATLVLDVSFDATDHPGIAGMRVSGYGGNASAAVLDYERFESAWGAGPFTMRVDPGMDYGMEVPAPDGPGGVRFEFYPQSHADDTVCAGDTCFLGVGATQGLSFKGLATVFYHEPAPEGWTRLDG